MVQQSAVKLFCLTLICLIGLTVSREVLAAEWIRDNVTGVKVWNPEPAPNETVRWSGGSEEGYAEGRGELKWFTHGRLVQRGQGGMNQGKMKGSWKVEFLNRGQIFEGTYWENRRHGQGKLTFVNGGVWEGEWLDGKYQPFVKRIQALRQPPWQVHDAMTHPYGMYVLISQLVSPKAANDPSGSGYQPSRQGLYLLSVGADGRDRWIKQLDTLYLTDGFRGSLQTDKGKLLAVITGQKNAGGQAKTLLYTYSRQGDMLNVKDLPAANALYLYFEDNGIRYFDRPSQQLVHLTLANYQSKPLRKVKELDAVNLQNAFQTEHSGGLWPVTMIL
ncbi:hypothetical protein [Acetonema longum]|uniref:MORN repeat-containing protein n=1 Tax=Acetonema longum DSM 6540 TaxID=1009370 RepID=F7NII7_9FIRM|nr:hypothetical protein [Acetonema longum]EGO64133.1 hypothetical protein ALO_09449 [Acetonema longum DSM 6540]